MRNTSLWLVSPHDPDVGLFASFLCDEKMAVAKQYHVCGLQGHSLILLQTPHATTWRPFADGLF